MEKVIDLTVPEDKLASALEEAETLPSVEISKLDCQWLQVPKNYEVRYSIFIYFLPRFLVRDGLLP